MSLLGKIEDVLPGLMREYRATGGFTNWHGSPHEFVAEAGAPYGRFSMKKIGTGQGAQVAGMGHYTADFKPVAEDYQRTLSQQQPKFEHPSFGVISPSKLTEYLASVSVAADPKRIGKLKAQQIGHEVVRAARTPGGIADLGMALESYKGHYPDQKAWSAALNAAADFDLVPNAGHLYETRIKGHPVEDFLYQDRPLSQQSDSVRAAMEDLRVPTIDRMGTQKQAAEDMLRQLQRSGQYDNASLVKAINGIREAKTQRELSVAMVAGSDEAMASPLREDYRKLAQQVIKERGMDTFGSGRGGYEQLVNRLGSKTKASEAMRGQGILGMRFLDAGSRGVGQGTYNTISFSDDVIEIVKRYGVAALIAAGVISEEMGRALQQQGIDSTFEEAA